MYILKENNLRTSMAVLILISSFIMAAGEVVALFLDLFDFFKGKKDLWIAAINVAAAIWGEFNNVISIMTSLGGRYNMWRSFIAYMWICLAIGVLFQGYLIYEAVIAVLNATNAARTEMILLLVMDIFFFAMFTLRQIAYFELYTTGAGGYVKYYSVGIKGMQGNRQIKTINVKDYSPYPLI